MLQTAVEKIYSFGISAEHFAARIPEGIRAVICDGTAPDEALATAVCLRNQGDPFFVAPILPNSRALIARVFAHKVFLQYPTYDQRRAPLAAIANGTFDVGTQTISKLTCYEPKAFETMKELLKLGDALLFRSQTERTMVEQLLNSSLPYVAIAPIKDPRIEAVAANPKGNEIVVWAPCEAAEALAIYSFALWNIKTPVTFVCQGELPNTPHRFVSPMHAGKVLECAGLIIDTNLTDPGTAIAFAESGFGIAAAITCGAHEYIQGAVAYDPADCSSILAAVSQARGIRTTHLCMPTVTRSTLQTVLDWSQPQISRVPPLVSIVVPTFNRRKELEATLNCLSRQTYPNLEVIVVNDAGEDVGDIVAHFPFARCITLSVNSKTTKAVNHGLEYVHGKYVGMLADDDCYYPSHVAKLVAALEAAQLEVANGNIIIRLDTKLTNGHDATYGHLLAYAGHLDHFEVLYAMNISLQGCLIGTNMFSEIGYLNTHRKIASDYDAILRLAENNDFVHVNTVTGEMRYRNDKTNMSSQSGMALVTELQELFADHCPPEYPSVAKRQAITVECVAINQGREAFFRPHLILDNFIAHEDI